MASSAKAVELARWILAGNPDGSDSEWLYRCAEVAADLAREVLCEDPAATTNT